jgi:hypothetical protein
MPTHEQIMTFVRRFLDKWVHTPNGHMGGPLSPVAGLYLRCSAHNRFKPTERGHLA